MGPFRPSAETLKEDEVRAAKLIFDIKELLADVTDGHFQRQQAIHALALLTILGDMACAEAIRNGEVGYEFSYLLARLGMLTRIMKERSMIAFKAHIVEMDPNDERIAEMQAHFLSEAVGMGWVRH
jgi:hypothetical protein